MSDKTEQTLDFWKKAILPPSSTIQDAATNLESSSMQIVLVVGKNDELIGTVSDGDIRRGLLQKKLINDPITSITQINPLVVPGNFDRKTVLSIMETNKIHQIPIVNGDNKVIGLHLWDQVITPIKRSNIMVIMAGGMGARMRHHTEAFPKPMLKLGGKPMLQHIIERGKSEGFRRFVISLNYLGHIIQDYFRSGENFDVEICYTHEETPLGTAGALSLINPLPDEPFVVTNGDVITDIRYGKVLDFHNQHKAVATMAVRLHEWQNPFGVVKLDGLRITGFKEKPVDRSYINAGVYVLDPKSLASLTKGAICDMPTLFQRLGQKKLATVAYAMHEEWIDVGQPGDYELAENTIN
jgi:dTDP-glucose pyrophosphorylase